MGGVKASEVCDITMELYHYCIQKNIRIQASHIYGQFNTHADALSCRSRDHCYSLPSHILNLISKKLPFTPVIDLFASRLNFELRKYFSEGPAGMPQGL